MSVSSCVIKSALRSSAIRETKRGSSYGGDTIVERERNESIKPDWITAFIRRRGSADVFSAGSAARKYGGDQQIPTAIIILLAGEFSRPGETVRGRPGKLSSARERQKQGTINYPSKFSGRG